jgi:hypothetical protein
VLLLLPPLLLLLLPPPPPPPPLLLLLPPLPLPLPQLLPLPLPLLPLGNVVFFATSTPNIKGPSQGLNDQRHMKQEFAHSKGKSLDKQRGAQSQPSGDAKAAPKRAAVASSIAKPEFKKHVHTNSSKSRADGPAAEAPLSRRQLKNLAKRKKKEAAAAEAAAAAGHDASLPPSSSTPHPAQPSSASATAAAKAKKAALDPGKKAEVNCNWQALKKALQSGGPLITRFPHTARFSFAAQRVRLSLLTPPPPTPHPTPPHPLSQPQLNHPQRRHTKAHRRRLLRPQQRSARRLLGRAGRRPRRRRVRQHKQHRRARLRNGGRYHPPLPPS